MAVRLVEKGVRMVQVYYAKGDPWDAHADIQAHRKNAKDSDQPFAAVIKDLKSRGLFKDTLVVCGSEFGRTPVMEVGGGAGTVQNGRDHNPFGFTMWLAGGGVKGGTIYGATDDFGFKAIEKPVHVHDLHATILHSARHRPHQADLPLQRPRLPPDRCVRQRASRHHHLILERAACAEVARLARDRRREGFSRAVNGARRLQPSGEWSAKASAERMWLA